ncbi:hypothetical protein [Mycolicibacterium sphagni]|uniref:hypothetical protein n=1 Tax=Mycolicibacterium sphagni TaxID=1786 RepID=UPI0021F30DB3|nr:hypothetical protein [Mycolicibacterium sphagni]MCV7174760.1 hypothetical protein [Mycolicibacterium sphagni]
MDVAYHWSPSTRRLGIHTDGLKIGAAPAVNSVGGDWHNSWISLSPTPAQAWSLSGGALEVGGFSTESPIWDLYEVDITGLPIARAATADYPELHISQDIPADRVVRVAMRLYG